MILIGACSASYERARAFISGLECPWQRRVDGLKDYGVPFSMQYKRFQNQESGALNFNALSTWGTSLPKLHLLFFLWQLFLSLGSSVVSGRVWNYM